jgi:formamidase
MNIKQLTAGSRLLLPVDVPGALVSVGDPHFAQGDGEICGVAIEMRARAYVRFDVVRATNIKWRPRYPTFEFTARPRSPVTKRYVVTTGLPIDHQGRNQFLDLNLAAKAAVEEMVNYLRDSRSLSPYDAYVLISVAGDLRISEVVDVPNAIVSVVLPLDIFGEDP